MTQIKIQDGLTTREGLLYRNGVFVDLPEADHVAALHGFHNVEQLIRHMEALKPPAEEKLDTETRGHHPNSPSSLQSSEACPHFKNEQRESAAATAGTLQHKAAETRDLSILDDVEHVAAVKRALAVEDAEIAFLKRMSADHNLGEVQIVKELYLPVDKSHREVDSQGVIWEGVTGGFPDVVLICGPLAVILDWKFGRQWVTPTESNLQGKSYARAAMEMWPEVQEVKVVFFHPYLEIDYEGNTRQDEDYTYVFTREDYSKLELVIRTVVAKKKLAAATGWYGPIPPTPKTALCLWCKRKATCPANGALMVQGASKHKDLTVPPEFNPAVLVRPEDFAAAYRFANQFELVAKAIKKRCTDAALTENIEIPGFALTRRRERILGEPAGVKSLIVEKGYLTPEEFDNCANVPITKVEERVKAKAAKGQGARVLRELQADLEDAGLVTVGEGYMYLREVKKKDAPAVEEKPLDI